MISKITLCVFGGFCLAIHLQNRAGKQDLSKQNMYFRSAVLNLTIFGIRIRYSDPDSVYCIQYFAFSRGKKKHQQLCNGYSPHVCTQRCPANQIFTELHEGGSRTHLNSRTQSCMNRAARVCKYLISLQDIYQQPNQGNKIEILTLICFGTRSKLQLTTSNMKPYGSDAHSHSDPCTLQASAVWRIESHPQHTMVSLRKAHFRRQMIDHSKSRIVFSNLFWTI